METYISQFKNQLAEYAAKCGEGEAFSILELLWKCYMEESQVDDGWIMKAEKAINPVFDSLSKERSDALYELVTDLCMAYQRAAFLEGIRTGFCLKEELAGEKFGR